MKIRSPFLRIILSVFLLFLNSCVSENTTPSPTPPGTPPPPEVHTSLLPTATAAAQSTQTGLKTETPLAGSTPAPQITAAPKKSEAEFGVEINSFDVDFGKIKELGAKWLRYNAVIWSDLEPVEGQINWEGLAALENGFKKASDAGLKLILIVRGTPTWAQKVDRYFCGQIQREKFSAFGDFLIQLLTRYRYAPYNVHYWELGNEPDIDPALVGPDSQYGCLGDKNDAYYGGEYYAEMLKSVVPGMRAVDPSVKIFNGGILLDCDPTDPGSPGRCKSGYELPPRFFEGVLKGGGRDALDYLSFHGYPSYNPKMYTPVLDEINWSSWQARGGVVAGKASFLRETLAQYHTDLPLFLTETAFLCPENLAQCNPVGPEFLQQQAEYGAWLVVRNYAENISAIWYLYNGPGWRNSAILDQNQNPRPVYKSIQTALRKIDGSSVLRKIDQFPGISGYEFQSPQGNFYFLAPVADQPPQWTAPENAAQALDIFGQPVPLNSLSPLTAPVFIELR